MKCSVLRFFGSLLLCSTVITGCKQDLVNTSWDVDVLAPVIQTRLTMADLLADSLLVANAEGALRLKVELALIDLPLDSILKIPDTTISNAIGVPIALNNVAPGTEIPIPLSSVTQYDLGELALSRVRLKRGRLRLKVKSIVGTAIDFTYRMPTAYLFGNAFESLQTIEAGSPTDTAVLVVEFDLAGYDIDLRGPQAAGFNTLVTDYTIRTSENGNTVSIAGPPNKFFFLEYGFLDLLPDYGAGYFGQQSSNVQDQNSEIDVLNRITEGQMFLDSVTIGLNVSNGVGADARFKLAQLKSINNRQNTTVELVHEIVGSTILLSRAQDLDGTASSVDPSEIHYEVNNANSNIKQFIQNLPDQLGFTFNFELNPLGNVSSGNDFFYYDRPFQALMNIDIPLRTTLTNLTLVDTLDWNLSQSGVVDMVNSGSFTLIAQNGFPLEGQVEMILLDSNMLELDTLLVPSTIAAPPLDADNKVVAPIESRIIIPVPNKTSNVLPQVRHVYLRVRFNTANQPALIEFYASYGIDIKLIGNFNLNFGPSTL